MDYQKVDWQSFDRCHQCKYFNFGAGESMLLCAVDPITARTGSGCDKWEELPHYLRLEAMTRQLAEQRIFMISPFAKGSLIALEKECQRINLSGQERHDLLKSLLLNCGLKEYFLSLLEG